MYQILSPDGFPIHTEPSETQEQAIASFHEWLKRYEQQGYYSSNKGRIPLEDVEIYCTLVEL